MRLFFSILLMCCLVVCGWSQTQQGVAYRYNGKKARTPLGNVTISYDANKRTTISGEQDGVFSLTLTGRKMGDRIGLVTVKKREMMVFNQHAVDEWSVRKEPLTLILCNADEFEKQKENLINIGKSEAKKKYDRQKAELEAKLNASQIKESEYESALDKAYEELERLQKNIGEYADLFARIDESEIDTLAQRAMDLFNQGDVERAIQLFEQGNYMEKLDKALKTSQQADQLKAVAGQAKEQATQDSLKAIQSLKAQIEAYKLKNEWKKAGELLKGLANRLNTIEDNWNYAYFCNNQNYLRDAEIYYKRSMSLLRFQFEKGRADYMGVEASLQNNLANLYYSSQRYAEAEKMYLSAMEIHQRLAASNPDTYEPRVASIRNNLATLYKDTQHYAEAEKMYLSALETYKRLAVSTPAVYEQYVATTQNNLATLYYITQRYADAEKMFLSVLEIHQCLADSTSATYEQYVATTQNNLANLYSETQRYANAEKMYLSALETYKHLAVSNSAAYEPSVAMTQNNLADLYSDTQRYADAEKMYLSALQICQRLAIFSSDSYGPYVAMVQNNLADLYSDTQRYADAEKMYLSVLETYKRLAASNPEAYESDLAKTLGNFSYVKIKMGKYAESEKYGREGLNTDSTQHWIATNLAAALLFQGKYAEAETIYRQYREELKDSFLDDFKQYAEAGVIPLEYEADVEKIKKLLEEY